MFKIVFALCLFITMQVNAQVWKPDAGDGTYKNPVLYADYSDPDVIRVGNNYYMVASSFTCQPGIPVLHSKDLVNWKIINYVYNICPCSGIKKYSTGKVPGHLLYVIIGGYSTCTFVHRRMACLWLLPQILQSRGLYTKCRM
jgi:hypothetical protein